MPIYFYREIALANSGVLELVEAEGEIAIIRIDVNHVDDVARQHFIDKIGGDNNVLEDSSQGKDLRMIFQHEIEGPIRNVRKFLRSLKNKINLWLFYKEDSPDWKEKINHCT